MKKHLVALSMLAAIGFAPPSHAVDGVYEISSACVSFGCVPGDSAGLPVTISQSGSFRLTSNLTTVNANTTLIEVTTNNVSIDLNGFSLLGPVACTTGNSVTCSPSTGTGTGIDAASRENVTIRNGVVSGMGFGLRAGRSAYLEELVVSDNALGGIDAQAPGSVLRRLSVRENGGDGVALGFGSSYLMDSVIYNNAGLGVFGGFCGNVLMSGNQNGAGIAESCTAIAPNRCEVATECD